jgi:hypothetical protein
MQARTNVVLSSDPLAAGGISLMTRPRGFVAVWEPRAESLALIDQVNAVLDDYAAQVPLTVRQIFYRLVGAYGYEKTERAYKRLGELLNKARRARLIDMDVIRDDGFISEGGGGFAGVDDFIEMVEDWAKDMHLDRQKGQARRLVVWCEASGMVPQLGAVAGPLWDRGVQLGRLRQPDRQAPHRAAVGSPRGSHRAASRRP